MRTEDRVSKYALMVTLLLTGCATGPQADRVATLHHDPQRILEAVAQRMKVQLRADIPVPEIRFESRTKLERMQTAAERQWGYRPDSFANVYAAAENCIYLIDDGEFYEQHGRTLDDALAHEYVHYLQTHYLRHQLDSEWSEATAIDLQVWFREQYMAPVLLASVAGARVHVR